MSPLADQPLSSPVTTGPCELNQSSLLNDTVNNFSLSSPFANFSSTVERTKVYLKKVVDRFPWIPMVDRPCCWNLKSCCIAEGWLMLISSLLVIIIVGQLMNDSCTIGVEVVTMNDGPSSLPRHRRSYHSSWSSWNAWEPLSTSTTTKPFTIKTFTQLPLSLNSVEEPIQSSLWSSHREYPSCKGYNLFAYQLLIASGGFIQLIASGFFIRGIYRVHSDYLLPYVMFLHMKIITDLHHCVFFLSIKRDFPAICTTLIVISLLSLDFFFMACANTMRIRVKTDEDVIRAQAAIRVVRV